MYMVYVDGPPTTWEGRKEEEHSCRIQLEILLLLGMLVMVLHTFLLVELW